MKPAAFWVLVASVALVALALWLGWHMNPSDLGFNLGGISKG